MPKVKIIPRWRLYRDVKWMGLFIPPQTVNKSLNDLPNTLFCFLLPLCLNYSLDAFWDWIEKISNEIHVDLHPDVPIVSSSTATPVILWACFCISIFGFRHTFSYLSLLRSGLWTGHSIQLIWFWSIYFLTIRARWAGALSSWYM